MSTQKVWFITGASKGFGLALVKALLAQGSQVAATSRQQQDLITAIGPHDRFLPLTVDLTSETSVQQALAQTVNTFGHLDVVVNNAGYGLLGGLEELTDQEVRQHFDVNVFALFHVIRHALPYLRQQRSGHIINISSTAGYMGYPANSSYNATKFAVVGLSEALALEMKPFGVHVTVVAPGMFRTNFMSGGSFRYGQNQIDDYTDLHAMKDFIEGNDGKQAGDPDMAAQVIIQLVEDPQPPLHLLLGSDAYQTISQHMSDLLADFETRKHISVSTDFAQ